MMLDWLGPMDKALFPPLPLDDDGEREEAICRTEENQK